MQARLSAHGLACRRGPRLLFRGLDLALEPGEAVHLIGPNGVGKTSALRILAGLLRPFAGHVERTGAAALLDEGTVLDPHLPLGRALGFWARLDGAGGGGEAMERLGLAELARVPVRFLSTGQRRRAGLARIVSQGAPIWLLDEPMSGLDAHGRSLVEEIIGAHRADGGACIAVSHQHFAGAAVRSLDLSDYAG